MPKKKATLTGKRALPAVSVAMLKKAAKNVARPRSDKGLSLHSSVPGPWDELAGIFANDADFASVKINMAEYRNSLDSSNVKS